MSSIVAPRGSEVFMRRVAFVGSSVLMLLVLPLSSAVGGVTASPPERHSRVQTVARGLDNPRGLAVLPDGRLFVAEAGHAGGLCLGPGECVGLNGKLTAIDLQTGHHRELAHGLPSFGGPFGAFGLGGVVLRQGRLSFVTGLNPQAFGKPSATCKGQRHFARCVRTIRKAKARSGLLNQLSSSSRDRGWSKLAAVGRFDFNYAARHPDPGNPEYAPGDANPFGVAAGPGGGHYVVDAASNTLDFVTKRGTVAVLAFVPDPTNHKPIYDAAPTCAARTPNGNVYIGTESSSLWRWDGSHLKRVLKGGKVGQVVGCVADRHGNVYLANLAARIRGSFPNFNEKPFDGSIVKVTPGLETSYLLSGLNLPSGLALGPDQRDLYVATNGLCPKNLSLLDRSNSPPGACPASGKVIRIRLDR
jgi:hypothetical protein